MDDIANKIVNKWIEIIESYSIKIESLQCFRMNKNYIGYPDIEFCYKVNFDFGLNPDYVMNYYEKNNRDRLMKELELNFIDRFQPILAPYNHNHYNSDEIKFHNSKVDYFTNQGHRIIIQFYPQGFIDELREDKLNQLGII